MHPIRRAGDGTRPVPGWDDDHEWIGWIPPEEMPFQIDPERGFVATANNDIQPPGYPYLIGKDFHRPYRVRRIERLLEERDDHDVASMQRIQDDTMSEAAASTLPLLIALEPRDDRQAAGARDAADVGRRHAGVVAPRRAVQRVERRDRARERWPRSWARNRSPRTTHRARRSNARSSPGSCASPTAGSTTSSCGRRSTTRSTRRRAPRGASSTRLRIAHPLAGIPGLEAVFTAMSEPFGGDEQTVAQGGFDGLEGYRPAVIPSWRVVWDLGDLERSVGVVPTGVSGNPASPHWNDQVGLYVRGEAKPYGFATDPVSVLTIRPA